jgi:predicted negative regulator of RcsB-dependent stress response
MENKSIQKIKEFFLKNEQKIVLVVAFCLISGISYGFGVLQGQKWQQQPLIIEKPTSTPTETQTAKIEASGGPEKVSAASSQISANLTGSMANCAYVGSKNSNKFYPPTCSYAKRIKPENVVCFKTAEEAIGQGRTESKCAN